MPIAQHILKQLAINNPVNDSGAYYPYVENMPVSHTENKHEVINIDVVDQQVDHTHMNRSNPVWDDLLYQSASLAAFEFTYSGDYS